MKIKIPGFLSMAYFLLSTLTVLSQTTENDTNNKAPNYDTSYIQNFTDQLGLYTFALRKYRTYGLKNKELKTKLKFEPNGQTNLGLGFNFKGMNFGISTSFDFMNKDNDVYGETSRLDLQLNVFSKFIGINAYYQNYAGFYLSNPEDLTNWKKQYYPYISDLQSSSLGVSVFYLFNNKRFSYKAAYIRNQVQKKSAGGIILGSFFDLDVVYAPSGFVPKEMPDSLNEIFNFNGYSTYVAGLSLGYTHTFVFLKRCFINLSVIPGIGYRTLSIWYVSSNKQINPSFTSSITTRGSIGYEGKQLYFGVSSISSSESFKFESVDISSNSGLLRFYIGKRFHIGKKNI